MKANSAGQLLQSKQTISVGVTPLDVRDEFSHQLLLHVMSMDALYSQSFQPSQEDVPSMAQSVADRLQQALMAYCRAHETIDSASLETLEKDLLRIQSLLITGESDDVDALQAAADESYEQAFNKSDGGTVWHFHQEADPSVVPTTAQIAAMSTLNSNQAVYDTSAREVATKRWQLFAQWWLYGACRISSKFLYIDPITVSGFGQSVPTATYQSNVASISQRLANLTSATGRQAQLQTNIQAATAAISNSAANQQPQQGTSDRFYQRKDPTILFGNIQAGFENDFNDLTEVRLQNQGKYPSISNAQPISTIL